MFTSSRERRLWLWALATVVAIFATLGATPSVAASLRERDLLFGGLWALGLLVMTAVVVVVSWTRRPRLVEISLGLGIFAAYGMIFARIRATEERTHLFEYGLVALLIYQALSERRREGDNLPPPTLPPPAILAVLMTAMVGTLDELIQAVLPNRVFDPNDMGFNALAAIMAVAAAAAVSWTRRRRQPT